MARKLSMLAPDWWDFTTLEDKLLNEVAKLSPKDMLELSRKGFKVVFYDTLEDFYLAEALEYITAWKQASARNPVGICGPIGPTEQLPLVARMVNELQLDLSLRSYRWLWKIMGQGEYVLGLEPCNIPGKNRKLLMEENILPWLKPGESSTNNLEIILSEIC